MPKLSRTPAHLTLQDVEAAEPRLQLSGELGAAPDEAGGAQRLRAAQTWQALQATPDDVIRDRRELDRMDRALLAVRKQFHAARAEAAAARAQVAQVEKERYAPSTVYGLGLLAAAAGAGWIWQRRRMVRMQESGDTVQLYQGASEAPLAFPPAAAPAVVSEFDPTDLSVHSDEADEWIERAKLALHTGDDGRPVAAPQ